MYEIIKNRYINPDQVVLIYPTDAMGSVLVMSDGTKLIVEGKLVEELAQEIENLQASTMIVSQLEWLGDYL